MNELKHEFETEVGSWCYFNQAKHANRWLRRNKQYLEESTWVQNCQNDDVLKDGLHLYPEPPIICVMFQLPN